VQSALGAGTRIAADFPFERVAGVAKSAGLIAPAPSPEAGLGLP
jgi:hypothetical protein